MAEHEEDRITWLGALRYMRDQFVTVFVTGWLYIILWGVVTGAFIVLLYIDGKFSRALAPDSIAPLSFQAMGWVYRFFAASFLMAAARCAYQGVKGGWTFNALGVFASVIVCLHAFGFGFEALSDRREQALATREIATIEVQSNTELIETLEARKAQIDADTNAAVDALNAEIRQYITDGLNNDDLADDSRERRTMLQDLAAADKRAIDDQILDLVASRNDARTDAVEETATAKPWAPLFVGLAQLATWTKEPTDWAIYLCAITFIIFWVLLAEALVIFLPERLYTMHLADREKSQRVEKERFERRSQAAKKGATTRRRGTKIEQSRQWWVARIRDITNARKAGDSPETVAKSYGWSLTAMKAYLKDWLDEREMKEIFEDEKKPETVVEEVSEEEVDDVNNDEPMHEPNNPV